MQQPAMHSYVCGIKRSENFLTSLYHKRRNAYAMACHSLIFDSRPGEVVFHIRQMLSVGSFGRCVNDFCCIPTERACR